MQFVSDLIDSITRAKCFQLKHFGKVNIRVVINRAGLMQLFELFPEYPEPPYQDAPPDGEFGTIEGVPMVAVNPAHWFGDVPMAAVVDEHAELIDFLASPP